MKVLKGLFLLSIAVLLSIHTVVGQTCLPGNTTLNSSGLVSGFSANNPGCTIILGNLTITQTVPTSQISNLWGLSDITEIQGDLEISYHDGLSTLTGLDNLTTIGGNLLIEFNEGLDNLNGLQNLTSIGGFLEINQNSGLTNIEGLENLTFVGGDVRLRLNQDLESLHGLESLTEVNGRLLISDSDALLNLEGLNNITTVHEDLAVLWCDDIVNFSGLESLTSISGLGISTNNSLTDLTGLNNLTSNDGVINIIHNPLLTDFNPLSNVYYVGGPNIRIENNGSLSTCVYPGLCNLLISAGNPEISMNVSGCNSAMEILNGCLSGDHGIYLLVYKIFYDLDQDGEQDPGEPIYPDANASFSDDIGVAFPVNGSSSYFTMEDGSYDITFNQSSAPGWQLTTPSSYQILLNSFNTRDTVCFGVFPTTSLSRIVTSAASGNARCLEEVVFDVNVKNPGTTIADGTVWLTIDENITSTTYIDQPDTIVPPNQVGWFFEELAPGHVMNWQIALGIPGPPDFEVGGELQFLTNALFEDVNGTQASGTFAYEPEVRCSYDPNDKLVHPSRNNNFTLFEEDIIYTIRFQNTGNDYAYHVTIRDTLDSNLDVSTFSVLGSSHYEKLETTIVDDQYLTFNFPYIFLPDSTTNLEGSQGYVTYLIRGKEGLAENTLITNSAGIYFDQNPPIITNTTENLMVSELPVGVFFPEGDNEWDISVFPNPTTGRLHLSGELNGVEVIIMDNTGRVVHQRTTNRETTVDLGGLPQGLYFLHLLSEKGRYVEKVLKF